MDGIEFFEKIGSGGFGHVHRGKWREDDVAVKKIGFENMDKEMVVSFLKEISILSELDHPNILKVIIYKSFSHNQKLVHWSLLRSSYLSCNRILVLC